MRALLLSSALALAACAESAPEAAIALSEPATEPAIAAEVQTDVPGITGHVEIIRAFPSTHVTPRDLHIWLPPSYAAGGGRYPVVYVHDGQNLYDPALSKYSQVDWGFDEAMTELIASGEARAAMVVGIASLEDERFENYMPQKATTPEVREAVRSQFAMNGWSLGTINSDDYLRFVVEEVKPFIDARYRTLPGRADTSMVGASMGGLVTTYALLEYPDVFGQGAGVSTHLPVGEGALVPYFADRLPAPGRTRFWFDYGTETLDADYAPYHEDLDARFIARGYTVEEDFVSRMYPGHSHSETDWRTRVADPLRFLLGPKTAS